MDIGIRVTVVGWCSGEVAPDIIQDLASWFVGVEMASAEGTATGATRAIRQR